MNEISQGADFDASATAAPQGSTGEEHPNTTSQQLLIGSQAQAAPCKD